MLRIMDRRKQSTELRVMHIIDSEGIFGAEKVILNLLPELKKKGVTSILGCLSPNESEGAKLGFLLKDLGIDVIFFNVRKKISISVIINISKALKQNKINILHSHGYKGNIIGGIAAAKTGIARISTYHGEAKNAKDLFFYLLIETFVLFGFNKIISVSKRIENELRNRGVPRKRIVTIPNGIPKFTSTVKRDIKSHSDRFPRLLCIGRLIKLKHFEDAIKAVAKLKHEFPTIILKIAGTGPEWSFLESTIKLYHVEGNVGLLGYVDNTEALYEEADIFLILSDTEGSPIVLLEAMSFSLPIVATAVGGIPDIVTDGHNALMVQALDPTIVMKKIRMLLNDKQLSERISRNARNTFMSHYTSSIMANNYISVYKTLTRN